MLVHEGSPGRLRLDERPGHRWGDIVNAYRRRRRDRLRSHPPGLQLLVPGPRVGRERRAVTNRPVVSAGQYGTNLNQLCSRSTARAARSSAKTQTILPLASTGSRRALPAYPAVPRSSTPPRTRRTCSARWARRDHGAVQPARSSRPTATTENRGGESTLGNLVAEVQRWATRGDRARRTSRS